MQIEEAKDILLNIIADEVIGTYCIEIQKEVDCSKNCEDEDCYLIQAIDTVINELKKKDKRIVVLEDINEKLNNINTELKEDTTCLHCGKDKASYCERLLSGSNKYKCKITIQTRQHKEYIRFRYNYRSI